MTAVPDMPAQPRKISGLGDTTATTLPVLELDKRTYDRALDCVHCGLCLPACPTYTANGLEADSPRGRIHLMKGLADGRIDYTDAVREHLDLCLDCRACETACPSGVVYHELIEETRQKLADRRPRGLVTRLVERMFFHVFPYPRRLKLAVLPARLMQRLGLWKLLLRPGVLRLMPAQIAKMQQMLPASGALWEKPLAKHHAANAAHMIQGRPRARVGFFPGCVGSVLFQPVNRKAIEVLTHVGCEVVVPEAQQCCGAIHHHGGQAPPAMAMAKANIDAFIDAEGRCTVDYIVNTIAGCGAMLRDYAHLLRDDPRYAARARTFVEHVRDISEVVVAIDPPRPTHRVLRTITYHDACHLAHAQKVTAPPRTLLSWIEGLTIRPLPESDMCCGAAGTYNLSQPAMAMQLGERKLDHIRATGAGTCVTGNVGCAMQIESEARRLQQPLEVIHPIVLLHEGYFGQMKD